MKTEIIICSNCKRSYRLEYIKYPCKMEEGRFWQTYYCCPYCKNSTDIIMPSNEDIKTHEM